MAITFPEGLTSQQIVDRLNADPVLTGDITDVPPEGSLMPDTYKFTRGATRKQILEQMQRAQARAVEEVWARRSPDLPLKTPGRTRHARFNRREGDRQGRRAPPGGGGVHQSPAAGHAAAIGPDHRLWRVRRSGQAGRSADHAIGPRPGDALQHLQDQRAAAGADRQPGPRGIGGGRQSLAHAELYFVADGTGGHAFAPTLDEHNRNVARWRRIEAAQSKAQDAAAAAAPPRLPDAPPARIRRRRAAASAPGAEAR
jgi:UPF0755 protein